MKTLLLDVMGTLVYDPFYREMPAFFQMTLEELIAVKHPQAWTEFENGAIDEQTFLCKFFRDGRSFDHAGLKRAMFRSYRFLDGILPLLEALRTAAVDIHLVSNYSLWYQEIEERLALSRYAPWTFMSCEWHCRKPKPEVYTGLLQRLNVAAQDCLFVDDSAANCAAAATQGMATHQFQDAATLARALREQGFLTPPSAIAKMAE